MNLNLYVFILVSVCVPSWYNFIIVVSVIMSFLFLVRYVGGTANNTWFCCTILCFFLFAAMFAHFIYFSG